MRYYPIIFAGCAMKRPKAKPARTTGSSNQDNVTPPEATEQKGDLLIRDLYNNETDIVHDMCVMNTDAKSNSTNPPEKCLPEAERAKKCMYLEACLQQHTHFYPFFPSVDGLLGVEATDTLNRIYSRLAIKWQKTYPRTCSYVKIRISITLVQATHRCIQGSSVPVYRISVQRLQWEDGAGINLFS